MKYTAELRETVEDGKKEVSRIRKTIDLWEEDLMLQRFLKLLIVEFYQIIYHKGGYYNEEQIESVQSTIRKMFIEYVLNDLHFYKFRKYRNYDYKAVLKDRKCNTFSHQSNFDTLRFLVKESKIYWPSCRISTNNVWNIAGEIFERYNLPFRNHYRMYRRVLDHIDNLFLIMKNFFYEIGLAQN